MLINKLTTFSWALTMWDVNAERCAVILCQKDVEH